MSWDGVADVALVTGDARTGSALEADGVHPAAVVGVVGAGEAVVSRGFFGAGVFGAAVAGTAHLAPITVKDRPTQPDCRLPLQSQEQQWAW